MEFKEYMSVEKAVNRWFLVKVFIAGAFAGALLAVAYSLMGFI